MAAALECWSGRPSTDEDMVEQVLMKTHDRSEVFPSSSACSSPLPAKGFSSPSFVQPNKWQRLGRSFAGAIATLKNSLKLDSARDLSPSSRATDRLFWGSILNLTQLYPGSQLRKKLISNVRRHFDSLPNSYSQAGFDVKDVLVHVRLVEQATLEGNPALHIQVVQEEPEPEGVVFKLTFASTSLLSWPAMSGALDSFLVCCKKIQVFEKKGLTLGVVTVLVQPGSERHFKSRIEAALRSAVKKPRNAVVKLPLGFCGCPEEILQNAEDYAHFNGEEGIGTENEALYCFRLLTLLPESPLVLSIDEWQTIRSGSEEIRRWLLGSDEVEFVDQVGPYSFRGVYKGKRVHVKKLKGCEHGSAYKVEVRQDLLQLMSCGQKNILQFHGICIIENNGLCVVTRMLDGGSVHDVIQRSKKVPIRDVMRIALDVAKGLMFINDRGVSYRDLNTQRILLDRQGNACLGDMGIVSSCSSVGEVLKYETAGYRWLAPEIIAGDPESVTETWMSNAYSFGMVIWEMVTGEVAYSSYSPVQAAVSIAACGLRPEIPKDCPQILRSLMMRCWNNCPAKRPQFSEITSMLLKHGKK